jgi:hypothetical protein
MSLAINRQPKPDGVTGRKKEEWPPLPREGEIAQYKIENVYKFLHERRNYRRPPDIAAPLLALVCWLYDRPTPYPFPSRERVAIWITGDESRDANNRLRKAGSVDTALTTALGLDEVREQTRVEPGRVAKHASARRYRFIIPSKELLAAYHGDRATTSERARA